MPKTHWTGCVNGPFLLSGGVPSAVVGKLSISKHRGTDILLFTVKGEENRKEEWSTIHCLLLSIPVLLLNCA